MRHNILFWLIIAINVAGALYVSVAVHGQQIAETSLLLWAFVSDVPSAALLFSVAFFFRGEARPRLIREIVAREIPRLRKRIPDLSFFWYMGIVGALKYGFWNIFVLLVFPEFFFTPANGLVYYVVMVFSVFLLFETMLLVGRVRMHDAFLPAVLFTYVVNDLSDYILGTHPPLPEASLGFMFPASLGMSVVFSLLGYLVLTRYAGELR